MSRLCRNRSPTPFRSPSSRTLKRRTPRLSCLSMICGNQPRPACGADIEGLRRGGRWPTRPLWAIPNTLRIPFAPQSFQSPGPQALALADRVRARRSSPQRSNFGGRNRLDPENGCSLQDVRGHRQGSQRSPRRPPAANADWIFLAT